VVAGPAYYQSFGICFPLDITGSSQLFDGSPSCSSIYRAFGLAPLRLRYSRSVLLKLKENLVASPLAIALRTRSFSLINFDGHQHVTDLGAPPAHHDSVFMPPPVSSDLLIKPLDSEYLV